MSSWGESPQDFGGEPRKVFINLLIWDIKQIYTTIFLTRRPHAGVLPLMGLIRTLDGKDKKALKKQYEQLEQMHNGKLTVRWGMVENIYGDVMTHLHKGILKEAFAAKPRYKGGKLDVPTR